MFKVVSAEIKKMVSKAGVYVLAVFLAIVLVLGVFLYNPTVQEINPLSLKGSVSSFYGDGSTYGYKLSADNKINLSIKAIASFNKDSETKKKYAEKLLSDYETAYKRMEVEINSNKDNVKPSVDAFILSIKNINDLVSDLSTYSTVGYDYSILSTTDNRTLYNQLYNQINGTNGIFNRLGSYKDKLTQYQLIKDQYENCIKSFTYPTIDENLVEDYTENKEGSRLNIIYDRLNKINEKIAKLRDETPIDQQVADTIFATELDNLANQYNDTATLYYELVRHELLSVAYDTVSPNVQRNLYLLEDQNQYNTNSELIKLRYVFDNNKVDGDYAEAFAVGTVINGNEKSAYDYSYFTLKLFSFIIIAYAIMNSCAAIAGEIKEGSMRYYAIRPITRSNILFGKLIANIVMCSIMLVFSTIISLCVGGAVYGFSTLNILTVFNGSTAIVMHPIAMLAIFVLSLIIEVTVYASIALLLSTLLKSDLLAITLMLLLYLINILLPVFIGGMNSWLMFYPFSHISLFAMFGSSITITDSNLLNQLLRVNIYAGSSMLVTSIVCLLLIILPLIIAARIFKRKEL